MSSSSDLNVDTTSSGGQKSGGGGGMKAKNVIRPSPVTEKSLLESVAGFINEVQQTSKQPNHHQSSSIHGNSSGNNVTWARFDTADVNDLKLDVNGNAAFSHGVIMATSDGRVGIRETSPLAPFYFFLLGKYYVVWVMTCWCPSWPNLVSLWQFNCS